MLKSGFKLQDCQQRWGVRWRRNWGGKGRLYGTSRTGQGLVFIEWRIQEWSIWGVSRGEQTGTTTDDCLHYCGEIWEA